MSPLAQLFLVCYGLFALATPVLVIALYVRYTKLEARVKAAEDETIRQAAALRHEITDLRKQVAAQKSAAPQEAIATSPRPPAVTVPEPSIPPKPAAHPFVPPPVAAAPPPSQEVPEAFRAGGPSVAAPAANSKRDAATACDASRATGAPGAIADDSRHAVGTIRAQAAGHTTDGNPVCTACLAFPALFASCKTTRAGAARSGGSAHRGPSYSALRKFAISRACSQAHHARPNE